MDVKDVADLARGTAGDGTSLAEILHPERGAPGLRCSLAHASLRPGASSYPHRLSSTEIYYILEGTGVMHVGEDSREVRAGQAVFIPPGAIQWVDNPGPATLAFLCIVDPPWRQEDEEILR